LNIFVLDLHPKIAAKFHNDFHIRKMIVESAQMLSTAHRFLDGDRYFEISQKNRRIERFKLKSEKEKFLYKAAYINHPCNVWARKSSENYLWLYELYKNLCLEFEYRFDKLHKTKTLDFYLKDLPINIKKEKRTFFAEAMPEYCKVKNDIVSSYRNYYLKEKKHLAVWTKQEAPYWMDL